MIIQLDHYRKSRTRATVDSYYSQRELGNTAPKRGLAKILYPAMRPAPRLPDNCESITTPIIKVLAPAAIVLTTCSPDSAKPTSA